MKYFTIRELTKSETAVRKGIDNTPSKEIEKSLTALVNNVLDPLREKWGAPIRISSGYRCPKLNKAIGGAAGSQHMKGEAADITSLSDSRNDNMALLQLLLNSGIVFDQVISEDVDSMSRPNWIHVSYTTKRANRKKRTTMKKVRGKTVYLSGIKI